MISTLQLVQRVVAGRRVRPFCSCPVLPPLGRGDLKLYVAELTGKKEGSRRGQQHSFFLVGRGVPRHMDAPLPSLSPRLQSTHAALSLLHCAINDQSIELLDTDARGVEVDGSRISDA